MNNKYSKENVSIGDRVLVSGDELSEGSHWGEVIQFQSSGGVLVAMDDKSILGAEHYESEDRRKCYYAYWEEVHDLVKPLVEDDRLSVAEGQLNISSNPLQKVIDDLTATHLYLEQVTGKKYSAQLKGFDLDSDNSWDSNMVTIKFVMEEK